MEKLKIDRTKLYTQAAFAIVIGKTRQRVNQMVKSNEIDTVEIKGAVLVYHEG